MEDEDSRKFPAKQALSKSSSSKAADLEDLAGLVCLALSDYALWADPDLRRKIDLDGEAPEHHQGDVNAESMNVDDDDLGYISLAYLFRHSPAFSLMSGLPSFVNQPETTYVKALRAHAADYIDVRLIVNPEVYSTSRTMAHWSKAATGYEVRRKNIARPNHSGYGKAYWDNSTVYVENIPIQYRSVPGILKFITVLLETSDNLHVAPRVQNIALLPHHQDKPGSIPVCKGFALVTLSNLEDAATLLEQWPWDVPRKNSEESAEESQNASFQLHKDARKFGFRCLGKTKWEELKAEYLLYRQQLVDEMNRYQDEELEMRMRKGTTPSTHRPGGAVANASERVASSKVAEESVKRPMDELSQIQVEGPKSIHSGSKYPSGCLVFVRNLHPETNKTTLRTFFSQAWNEDSRSVEQGSASAGGDPALDYLDYTKGMDRCHVRLSTPSHAQRLVSYFSTHSIHQTSGLDGVGSASPPAHASSPASAVAPELVLGKREEVYWEKVPEKVRRQAVDKALKLLFSSDNGSRNRGPKRSKQPHFA